MRHSKLVMKAVVMLACGVVSTVAARSARADIFITGGDDGFNATCNIRRAIRGINNGANDGACTGITTGSNVINFANVAVSRIDSTLGSITLNAGRSVTFKGAGYAQTFIERDPANAGANTNLIMNGRADFVGMTFRNFQTKVIFADAVTSLNYVRFLNNKGNFTSSGGCLSASPNAVVQVQFAEFDFCEGTTGAAILNSGRLTVNNSTFVRNSGERGAAIYNGVGAQLMVSDSTFGANRTTVYGSAIQNGGTASIYNSTIAFNVCNSNFPDLCSAVSNPSPARMDMYRSVIAKNTGSTKPNCVGTAINSGGGNLFGETATSCAHTAGVNDLASQDPRLGVATGNMPDYFGGVGRVYLPNADSPLLGSLTSANCTGEDQRGVGRLSESCDIGAVELARALLVVNSSSSLTTGDTKLRNTLTRLGFTVTVVSGASSTAADTSGKALVVIAESVTSSEVNTKFRDVGIGVLVSEPALFDDMRMTGTASTEFGSSSVSGVTIPNGDCPLASAVGFSGFKAATSGTSAYAWGVSTFGPSQCASVSNTHWGIFRYGTGWPLPGGSFTPAARVGFFGMDSMLGGLNADGTRMLEESILMACGI